jgi:hypothetical protein
MKKDNFFMCFVENVNKIEDKRDPFNVCNIPFLMEVFFLECKMTYWRIVDISEKSFLAYSI